MRHALHTFKQYFITYKPIYKTSQRLSATEPRAPFSTSGLQVSETSPFLWDWEWILFSYTCIHRLLRCRTVRDCDGGEDGILSASSRPAEPVISEVEIHRASSNRPRPWSSSHRITASVGPGPQPEQQHARVRLCPLSDLAFLQTHSRLFILLDMEETWMDPYAGWRFTAEHQPGSSVMSICGRAPYNSELSILFTGDTSQRTMGLSAWGMQR
ncbi:uncharacterized protein LOC126392948 isoform X1 [Epinephelus moara]|uniref:uncharacterized protein LOC126392948 isoform X1 n=1 Tax=Epinephelus moara TaxID=300413 RepID=UPI00214EACA3|nr:uncharacterized protein LOC126392948 isoform X1 [Epinephelus moara]